MAIQLTKIGNSPNTPTKDYVCDLRIEIEKLPKVVMGSTCFCLEDKSAWVKGSDEWKEITSPTSSNKELEILEQLIDQSGVLDSTDGTATEKVEQLINLAEYKERFRQTMQDSIDFSYNTTNFQIFDGWQISEELLNGLDFSKVTRFDCTFYKNYVIKNIKLDTSSCTYLAKTCFECLALETVIFTDTSKVQTWNGVFANCRNLKTVGTLNGTSATGTMNTVFNSCNKLENISFVPETIKVSITISSPVLTDESIQSIIDGLATVETAQTLTLNATVKAKLTETQLTTITSKNWNLA